MCYTDSCLLDSDPWEQGQWALSPLVPAKVVTVVRMLCLIVIPPLDVHLGKGRKRRNIFFSRYASGATSLSLRQPAHLLILFNKNFSVPVLSGIFCHSQEVNCNSEMMLGNLMMLWCQVSPPPLSLSLSLSLSQALSSSGNRQKPKLNQQSWKRLRIL